MSEQLGRPTIMTPETISRLREAFLMGCTDREACIYADISQSTLYLYQQENNEFSEQKNTWKINPVLKARKTIFDNLDSVGVAKWYLEKKAREEFGTIEVEDSSQPMKIMFVDEDDEI